ncbi:MAG: hypothetical protein LLG44_05355 [Chloroflexi bacterium]|nr:hypothetical protein [Chloroflexota bacterium]
MRTTYVQNESPAFKLRATEDNTQYTEKDVADISVVVVPDIDKHLETVAGAPYGSIENTNSLNVWVLSEFAEKLGLVVGEKYQLNYPFRTSHSIEIEIAGIVQAINVQEEFWYQRPNSLLSQALLTTADGYNTFVSPIVPEGIGYLFWYFVFDDSGLNLTNATRYISVLERAQLEVGQSLPSGRMDVAPLEELARARERKRDLSLMLTALTVPMIVVLVQFIVIVSSTFARSNARHDTMVISRGASRGQLLRLTLVESVMCLLIALPLGLFLGVQLAKLLGLADGFLTFTKRDALPVYLAALDWQPIVVAIAIGVLARLWASSSHANLSIVTYEHQAAGRGKLYTGLSLVLVGLLVAITVYAYRQLVTSGGIPLVMTADAATFPDPLLLLAPSLFLVTVPLILAESTSWLIGLFTKLFDPVLPATVLVAFRQMAREKTRSRAPVFILVISLSLGVFYASLAYSSQIWMQDRLRHTVGADITFDHATLEEQTAAGQPTGEDAWLLPAQEYEQIEGVDRATRVANYLAQTRVGRGEQKIKLIGIERLSFPAVAYIRHDYAAQPFGQLMNQLALEPQGALVPARIIEKYGLNIGDPLNVSYTYEEETFTLSYKIVGMFDYFPTVNEGELAAVVNIESIFEGVGQVLPHSVWMKTSPTANVRNIMKTIENRGIIPGHVRILRDMTETEASRREYIGTLGMMSVSFLASLLIAAVGTLVHLFASLAHHKGVFALLRGIGFHLQNIIASILIEYVLIIATGIAWGASVGLAASKLYGRYFPLMTTIESAVPPYVAYTDVRTTYWIVATMAATSLAIMTFVYQYLKRQRIFETLRMGQYE